MAEVTQAGQRICRSDVLSEREPGVRFNVRWHGAIRQAFVVRHQCKDYGYLNRCAHQQLELDWVQARFFDESGEHLICAAHGAQYLPATGDCTGEPFRGGRLISLPVGEADGLVFLRPNDALHLVCSKLIKNTARQTS